MKSLYGIESDAECREKINELLEMHRRAEQEMGKEAVKALTDSLTKYHKMGNSDRARKKMSEVEDHFFWPAISHAHAEAPKLNSSKTWQEGLAGIKLNLTYYRPKDK
jgi:hypothetical protein